eukprot:scpid98046/ scgid2258/ 
MCSAQPSWEGRSPAGKERAQRIREVRDLLQRSEIVAESKADEEEKSEQAPEKEKKEKFMHTVPKREPHQGPVGLESGLLPSSLSGSSAPSSLSGTAASSGTAARAPSIGSTSSSSTSTLASNSSVPAGSAAAPISTSAS